MARTIREVKRTRLVYGEGAVEGEFLHHLHRCYFSRSGIWSVKADHGVGGSPESILRSVLQRLERTEFDEVYLLLDTDRPWSDALKDRAAEYNVRLIGSDPCIEGLFLRILAHRPGKWEKDCQNAKRIFYGEYARRKRENIDSQCCEKLFRPDVLEISRKSVALLDSLIMLFE